MKTSLLLSRFPGWPPGLRGPLKNASDWGVKLGAGGFPDA